MLKAKKIRLDVSAQDAATLEFMPDSYPHFTNGAEPQSECPEANGCKVSQPFQMVRQPGGPS